MMHVRELLAKKHSTVITIEPELDVGAAARLIMRNDIGGLPVVTTGGELVGFIAERDIVRVVDSSDEKVRAIRVEHAMRRPAPVCSIDDSLHDVMTRVTARRQRHLVVLDGARIAGVISVGDLVKNRLEELELETGVLRDYVAARRAMG
jgi:CBS domain-containing protein